VKPSDLVPSTISSAPPVGEVLKSRLDTLDQEMRRILEMPENDLHLKIRLYLETLRQYIMSARQLDQSLQQSDKSSAPPMPQPLLLVNQETQATGEEEESVRSRKHRLVATRSSTPPVVKRQRQQVGDSNAFEEEDLVFTTAQAPLPVATEVETEPFTPLPAVAASSGERQIRPMRQSFYEVAEHGKDPYSIESLVHMMPDSRKEDARKLLKHIENSNSMRWDPTTGLVYHDERPISKTNLIDAFLRKRFSTTSQAKGSAMTGYEEFKNALQIARGVGGQKGEGTLKRRITSWLRY
jgi:uncharacterized protein YueI